MTECYECKIKSDNFYKSSLEKKDFICKECSVKRGKRNRLKKSEQNDIHAKYVYARGSAKSNKKPFLLTEEEYASVVSRPCFYCNVPMNGSGIGLDRINNDKSIGYTLKNVLPCCGFCNRVRGHLLTVEEAKVAIAAILEFRKGQ